MQPGSALGVDEGKAMRTALLVLDALVCCDIIDVL